MNSSPVLPKTALTEDLRLEVKSELEKHWRRDRIEEVYKPEIRGFWSNSDGWRTLGGATNSNSDRILWQMDRFTNKLTTLYFTPSGPHHRQRIWGAIYKRWFAYYNDEPNIEFNHFFAEPAHVTPDDPNTIKKIVRLHKTFCDRASQIIKSTRPDPQRPRSLHPLYRAVLLIVDEEVDQQGADSISEERKQHGVGSLDSVAKAQNVLMVRTGDESLLSTPIAFDQIQGPILPLRRSDSTEGIEVVRVSLATAIHFISSLEDREEKSSVTNNNNNNDRVLDRSLRLPYERSGKTYDTTSRDVWVENILQEAEEIGFENVRPAKYALRRVLATRAGVVDVRAQGELEELLLHGWE